MGQLRLIAEKPLQLTFDDSFNLRCRDAPAISTLPTCVLKPVRDVVAVALVAFFGMGRTSADHPFHQIEFPSEGGRRDCSSAKLVAAPALQAALALFRMLHHQRLARVLLREVNCDGALCRCKWGSRADDRDCRGQRACRAGCPLLPLFGSIPLQQPPRPERWHRFELEVAVKEMANGPSLCPRRSPAFCFLPGSQAEPYRPSTCPCSWKQRSCPGSAQQ